MRDQQDARRREEDEAATKMQSVQRGNAVRKGNKGTLQKQKTNRDGLGNEDADEFAATSRVWEDDVDDGDRGRATMQ